MRKQCVVLEHCVDRALVGRKVFNLFAEQKYLAGGCMFKTCDQAQQGCFAASGWPQQGKKLVGLNIGRDIAESGDSAFATAKHLDDIANAQCYCGGFG